MQPKMLAAAGAAGVAIAFAAWFGFRSFGGSLPGGGRELRTAGEAAAARQDRSGGARRPGLSEDAPGGERELTLDGSGRPTQQPGWVRGDPMNDADSMTFDFANSPEDAARAIAVGIDAAITAVVAAHPQGAPEGGWRSVLETWQAFVSPVIAGDKDAFINAVASMGGRTTPDPRDVAASEGDEDATPPQSPAAHLYDRLSALLEGSPVDVSNARVRDLDTSERGAVPRMPNMPGNFRPEGGLAMMMMVDEQRENGGPSIETHTLVIPLSGVFPNADRAVERGARTLEVWAPVRLAGKRGSDPDIGLATIMVRDSASARWVPAGLRLRLQSERARDHVAGALRPRTED